MLLMLCVCYPCPKKVEIADTHLDQNRRLHEHCIETALARMRKSDEDHRAVMQKTQEIWERIQAQSQVQMLGHQKQNVLLQQLEHKVSEQQRLLEMARAMANQECGCHLSCYNLPWCVHFTSNRALQYVAFGQENACGGGASSSGASFNGNAPAFVKDTVQAWQHALWLCALA